MLKIISVLNLLTTFRGMVFGFLFFVKMTSLVFNSIWKHEPHGSDFDAEFWTFYGFLSMIFNKVDLAYWNVHGPFIFFVLQ